MEEKKETQGGLFKVRSYLGCLSEGMKLPTRNILSLLKFLYPSFIVGVLVALCGIYLSDFMSVRWIGGDLTAFWIGLMVFIILLFLSVSFYWGQLSMTVSHYVRTGSLAQVGRCSVFKEFGRAFGRACVVFAPWCVFFMCACSAFLLVASGLVAPVFKWVVPVVALVFILLLYVPYHIVICDYLLDGSRSYWVCMSRMKDGYRNWGAFLSVLLCGGVLCSVISMVSALPVSVLSIVRFQATMAEAIGDSVDLPSCFSLLRIVSCIVASVISYMGAWLLVFPLSFLYGSIETGKREKEKYEEEERMFQHK